MRFFATCARGLEPILVQELHGLGAEAVEQGRGGVAFAGDQTILYKANLWLRTAIRVLVPILEADVSSPDELYEAVKGLDWSQYMTPEQTLAVDCNVRDSHLTHSKYAALRVKDAICDQFVEKVGRRPSVDTERPMVGLNLHVYRDLAVLSLDSSGDSLHKRGYRPVLTIAPLNEALAAALVWFSGWDPATPFIDPLCGSGTLPIEATWLAVHRPPGLTRPWFGFQGWLDFNRDLWLSLRDDGRRATRPHLEAPVVGFDQRRDVVEFARANARAAGIGHVVRFDVCSLHDFRPPDGPPGTLVCNPPYGERLGEEKELRGLYRMFGEIFRERCKGWKACVFTGNPRLAAEIGMRPVEETPLYNGKIACRLLHFRP